MLDGGGIHNASSGEFTVLDTTIRDNRAMNGGGFTNASDSTLVMRRSLIHAQHARSARRRPRTRRRAATAAASTASATAAG